MLLIENLIFWGFDSTWKVLHIVLSCNPEMFKQIFPLHFTDVVYNLSLYFRPFVFSVCVGVSLQFLAVLELAI